MPEFQSFRELINAWPTVRAFSRDMGVHYETARKMRARNNVLHEYWSDLLAAAKGRDIKLDLQDLMALSRSRRRQRLPSLLDRRRLLEEQRLARETKRRRPLVRQRKRRRRRQQQRAASQQAAA